MAKENKQQASPLKKDEIAHMLACAHFIQMYELASVKAQGGANWEKVKDMTMEQFMERYAPNGVRLQFDQQWHLDHFKMEVDRILPNMQPWPKEVEEMAQPAHMPAEDFPIAAKTEFNPQPMVPRNEPNP